MTTKARTEKAAPETIGGRDGGGAAGLVVMLTGALVTAYLFKTNSDPKPFEAYKLINTGLCLWLPLLVILLGLRQEPSHFGLTRGDRRVGLKWALLAWIAMLLPVALYARFPQTQNYYLYGLLSQPISGLGQVFDGLHVNPKALLYYELAMGFYMFCWEFFFRGFLLFGLLKTRLGSWGAVVIQSLPFALLHWSPTASAAKPTPEVIGSIVAALALGALAVRTRSFLYGYLAHWMVSVTLDVFLLAPFIIRHAG